MTNLYVYYDGSTDYTYQYSCSQDEAIQGFVGLHFFKQSVPNTLTSPVLSLLVGTNTDPADFNTCKGVFGRPQSGSTANHNMYALAQLRLPLNPIIV